MKGKTKYDEARYQFDIGNVEEAFYAFKKLAEDASIDQKIRAYSYAMMGTINGNLMNLDPVEDSGVEYYRKAFELDPTDVGLLLNIVFSFGNEPFLHHDREFFSRAYGLLVENYWNELTPDQQKSVKKIYDEDFNGSGPKSTESN